jgi:uncharacterized protein YpmB
MASDKPVANAVESTLNAGDLVDIHLVNGQTDTVRVWDVAENIGRVVFSLEDEDGEAMFKNLIREDGEWHYGFSDDVESLEVVTPDDDDTDADNIWVAADDAGILMTDGGRDVLDDTSDVTSREDLDVGDTVAISYEDGRTETYTLWDVEEYCDEDVYNLEDESGEAVFSTLVVSEDEVDVTFEAAMTHIELVDDEQAVPPMDEVVDIDEQYHDELTGEMFFRPASEFHEFHIPGENVWPALFAAYERLTGEPANVIDPKPVMYGLVLAYQCGKEDYEELACDIRKREQENEEVSSGDF